MTTIRRVRNIRITIHPGDHRPPHFHIYGPGWRVSVDIETGEVIAGEASQNELRRALEDADAVMDEIRAEWDRLNG